MCYFSVNLSDNLGVMSPKQMWLHSPHVYVFQTLSAVSPLQRRVTQLKQFTQQLQSVHPNVLAKVLHKSIVFQNQDVIVINKPYGVPVHGTSLCKFRCIHFLH